MELGRYLSMSESEQSAELVAEKLRHTLDLIKSENDSLRSELQHQRELNDRRLNELEKKSNDFETRIRSLQDSATTFKTWSGYYKARVGSINGKRCYNFCLC